MTNIWLKAPGMTLSTAVSVFASAIFLNNNAINSANTSKRTDTRIIVNQLEYLL